MTDHDTPKLWAPWRMEYIRTIKTPGCIFCDKPAVDEDRENLLLFRGEEAFVLMNLYPYNNGHLLVAPYAHVDSIEKLPSSTLTEIMSLVQLSMRAIREEMNPQGFNVGVNQGEIAGAGIAEHVHFHIVPRWAGDTNFMPITGHAKVIVQGLTDTYDCLKPHFDRSVGKSSEQSGKL